MPRTALTPVAAPGSYATAATAFTFTAADVGNGNDFALLGGEILLIFNSHATTTFAFTLTSVSNADVLNRSGTITAETIAAGIYKMFGPIQLRGWLQTDGKFYLSATDAAVKFAIIRP